MCVFCSTLWLYHPCVPPALAKGSTYWRAHGLTRIRFGAMKLPVFAVLACLVLAGVCQAQNVSYAPTDPSQVKLTVMFMNWKRHVELQEIIAQYTKYDIVDEILVWMAHRDTIFHFDHPKVHIIVDPKANSMYGLSLRFKGCSIARNPWVLIQDDDIVTSEAGMVQLVKEKIEHPDRVVCFLGRHWQGAPLYNTNPTGPGPVKICLTVILLTERRFCQAFFDYSHLVEDVVADTTPFWNGEDIFHSLVSTKLSGNLPWVAQGYNYLNYTKPSHAGISVRMKGNHVRQRNVVLNAAVERLGLHDVMYQ